MGKIETPLKQLQSTIGKNIVTAISNRHLAKDRMFFQKRTFDEFVADPLSVDSKRIQAQNDPQVKTKVVDAILLRERLDVWNEKFDLQNHS